METRTMRSSERDAVDFSIRVLKKNGLIIYPTETSYGIGADATSLSGIKRIKKLKRREGKFIPMIVSDMKMAERYIVLNNDMKKLIRQFMPGPLTLVADKKNMRTAKLLGGFRIPANDFAIKLVKKFGRPLTATSANMSGKPPIYRISEAKKIFSGKVELIIDSGNLKRRKPSTVFDVKEKKVLREGMVKIKDIMKAIS